jgi:hypothetical protein
MATHRESAALPAEWRCYAATMPHDASCVTSVLNDLVAASTAGATQ